MFTRLHNFFGSPIRYLHAKLSQRQFFVVAGILVGASSGIAAVVLKYFVHTIGRFVTFYSNYYEEFFSFAIFPLVGLLLAYAYARYVLKGGLKKGSAEIVYTIAKKQSQIPASEITGHMATSALTVGFGGSVGLESPLVSTGSAIGSNFGRVYNLSYKERTILLACGASAAIAAAFSSPIAGVLFAVEVLLTDVSATAFIPLIISAATGALLAKVVLEEGVLMSFSLQQPFNYHNVPHYIVLGILAGFISLYYTRVFAWTESKVKMVKNPWHRVGLGGLLMFVLLIFFPPLFGEGYDTIKDLAALHPQSLTQATVFKKMLGSDASLLLFLGALMFLKCIAAAITLGSGGNGGNFAPSLFVGAYLGFIFSRAVNLLGFSHIPETNFTLVGMAGILSGIFYAPLTAIFLIAEITGGYGLIIPLMIVSALSITVVHFFEPVSPEGKKLAAMLDLSVDTRDRFLLSKLDLSSLIETNFSSIKPSDSLATLIKVIAASSRNTFPVIDEQNELVGIVHLDSIRNIIFNPQNHAHMEVKDLMAKPAAIINTKENLHSVLKKFDDTNQWNLPVVEHKVYKGFVSKSSVLSKYRLELLKSV